MKFHRLYADEDGESHYEEMEATYTPMEYAPPAPPLEVSEPTDAARYVMVRFPPGWDSGLHPTPRRQLLVLFSGEIEGMASDGTQLVLKPGEVLLMEDTEGKGHTARVRSEGEALAMMVHLE